MNFKYSFNIHYIVCCLIKKVGVEEVKFFKMFNKFNCHLKIFPF